MPDIAGGRKSAIEQLYKVIKIIIPIAKTCILWYLNVHKSVTNAKKRNSSAREMWREPLAGEKRTGSGRELTSEQLAERACAVGGAGNWPLKQEGIG